MFSTARENSKVDYKDNQNLKANISKVAPEVVLLYLILEIKNLKVLRRKSAELF